MADGPRCKRRKQANPKRSSVTNFNNGLEASSDSDDEDKLHIVEEDSLQDTEATATDGTKKESHKVTTTVLPQNGSLNGVKEECVSEEEEEEDEEEEEEEEEETVKEALVEELLQQEDTAIIYPEAPEDEQSAAETGGADENGTPDSFSQLHICPYCSRGYKRNASLKEHIKYRHETSDDNYSCSHCSYTFTYRSQLERHMSHHRGSKDESPRHVSQSSGGSGGTRKFKCTECSKAFKYKHHLKEHLRIHSGEKPYECSNCKKRFSHSGSYSSHISSKKCVAANYPNGVSQSSIKPLQPSSQPIPVTIAPARVILKDKTESKPLQEQLPVTQIKSEPVEEECKPVMAAPATSTGTNGVVNRATVGTALPQGVAMVVPTLGLMSPISINLSDLQNVLKVAMDGNVLRQVLGSANGVVAQGKQGIVVQQPQQQILSLPAFVDHDGTTKIIINYSISPAAATTANTQPTSLVVKTSSALAPTVPSAAAAPVPSKTDQTCSSEEATDLSLVKTEPESVPISETEAEEGTVKSPEPPLAQTPKSNGTCLLCDECPEHLEALHLLQHRKAANGEAVDSAALDPSFADLLSEAGVTLDEPSPAEDVLSVLKTSFASNAKPSDSELEKISESISIPIDVVQKWFAKMNNRKNRVTDQTETTEDVPKQTEEAEEDDEMPEKTDSQSTSSPPLSPHRDLVIVKSEPEDPDAPDSQAEPLDLSLPKQTSPDLGSENTPAPPSQQEHPLNLTCLSKEQLEGRTIYVTTPQTGNSVNIVTTAQLPTLVAIAGQGTMGCLSTINTTTKRTILIPQLTYTYATTAGSATGAKTVVLNGHKTENKPESASESVTPTADDQSDSDAAALKKRRLESGVYPCDLCSKVFQKGSSLLRHKYEHTGKRPHECSVCKKAFKHKHHLIEHSRLHSGEKPYQCDKCGKRFSHSGSYSQHMNHRYSYCKKDGTAPSSSSEMPLIGPSDGPLDSPGAAALSDSRTTSPPSQLDSDEREDSEDEEDEEAMCMDDIRVVEVDDMDELGEEEYNQEQEVGRDKEEMEEEVGKGQTEEEEAGGEVMEIELGEGLVASDEDLEENAGEKEEVEEVEGKDCDKHIREGSGDEEPTTENAK